MSVKKYREKRNFKLTPEPLGSKKSVRSKHLYVIQKHAASHLHYDFRIEMSGVLKSWAIPKGPSLNPQVKRLAVHVEDHPLDYGNFEGTIPKGEYGGGTVMLWDIGTWHPKDASMTKAYQKGHLTFELKGKKLKGLWNLIRINNDNKNWLLIKIKDNTASDDLTDTILQKKPLSVLTGKTMDQITHSIDIPDAVKSRLPQTITPELATLVEKPPIGNDWLHEIKFDGYRLICVIKRKKIHLYTRNKNDWTKKFKSILKDLEGIEVENAIFDGEIVVLDENQRSNFQYLQNALKQNNSYHFIYYIFDLIYYNGLDLSKTPLIERKKILGKLFPSKNHGSIRYSDHILGKGDKIFKKSCKLMLEGIVSKNIYSHYISKRTTDWLKIKCFKRQEFVIGGYTSPQGSRQYFGSLLIGVYSKNKKFKYCGHVGTGFTEESLKSLFTLLKKHESSEPHFSETTLIKTAHVHWLKPTVVIEVEFTEWTQSGVLRHPSFKGIRNDKKASDVILEKSKKL